MLHLGPVSRLRIFPVRVKAPAFRPQLPWGESTLVAQMNHEIGRSPLPEKLDQEAWASLLKEATLSIGGAKAWHWFSHHFSMRPPHALGRSIVDACADCEKKLPGLGFQFIKDIAAICGKEKYEPHYDQLLQKLAELLVLRKLLTLDWPAGTTFQHEPAVSAAGKRPELRVVTPDRSFLFEVKTPSLLEHIRARRTNAFQVAGRVLLLAAVQIRVKTATKTACLHGCKRPTAALTAMRKHPKPLRRKGSASPGYHPPLTQATYAPDF